MSDDRQLLEMAAKAYGLAHEGWVDDYDDGRGGTGPGLLVWTPERGVYVWNPLTDDGDALRLAVKLRINLTFTRGLGAGHKTEYTQAVPSTLGHLAEFCPLDGDANAIIRRAIVRAAASIGATHEQ